MGNHKKRNKKKAGGQNQDPCELCTSRDKTKPMVACDVCDKWHHFECVNITSIGKNETWLCDKCKPSSSDKHKSTNDKSQPPKRSCELCRHADNDEMIRCNNCDQKFHFVCVEPDLDNLPKPFICMKCYENELKTVETTQNTPAVSISTRTKDLVDRLCDFSHNIHPLSVADSFQRRNTQLELDYLEEQRKFHEMRDKEKELREQQYLLRKYEILKENNDPKIPPSQGTHRSVYTENWFHNQLKSQQQLDREEIQSKSKKSQQHDNVSSLDMSDFERRLNKLRYDSTSPLKRPVEPMKQSSHRSQQFVSSRPVSPNLDGSKMKPIDPKEISKTENQVTSPVVPDVDTQPKKVSPETHTLSKAQIASRHVVKSTLTHFYGDPLEWTLWYSRYETSTELCGYSNGENLLRLKGCLKGNAEKAVRHRLMSPAEVPNIINTLRMLYGRPELIVNALLKNIQEITPPKADKLETLVDYAMEVNNVTATIESAKLHYHLSNPTLIHELVEKLPIHAKIDWAKYKATQPKVTLKMLAEWLYSLAEILCTVTVPSASKPDVKTNKKPRKEFERVNVHQVEKEIPRSFKSPNENKASGYIARPADQCKICNKKCSDVSQCSTFKSYDNKQKWDAVNKNKLCRKCLRCHSGYCRFTKECGVNGCVFKHHPVLHNDRQQDKNESSKSIEYANATSVVTNNFHNTSIPNVLFRIVPVTLYNNEIKVKTFAYLDEGSSGTLIEKGLAEELQIVGSPERLCLQWTNNVHRIEAGSCKMDLEISGQNEFSARHKLKGVRSVNDLGLPVQTIDKRKLVEKFPYLIGVPLIDYVNETPGILIGLPHARLCTQLTTAEGNEYQPIASKSRIGWSLHGPTREQQQNYIQRVNEHRVTVCDERQRQSYQELHRLVKEHFTLENFGVKINADFNLNSKENERALKILKTQTRRVDGRFETSLLWRYDTFELEDSYKMAKRRLICLEKSKKNYIQTIDDTIKDYIAKGYVTKLKPEDLSAARAKVGYLPIFIVVYPKKPDKLRLVFDAAAKTNGTSLNDMLLKGPDQLNSLIDILRRFRQHTVAICADIFEMYHQIKVCEADKHVQRFLWRNGNSDQEPDVYVLNVMTFGAKCSPSAAQFVKNTNAEEFRDKFPKAVDAIVLNTYVDDMMDGDETDEKVIQLVKDVQKVHESGGFKIGKFLSNSPKVLQELGVPQSAETKNLGMDPIQSLERVLGMFWNTTTDCFMFSLKYTKINEEVVSGKRYPTKREILQTLMSIFDPLGLLQHFLVRLKVLLQKTWRSKLLWDDQLDTEDQKESWDSWFRLLPEIEKLEIPRLYSSNLSTSSIELHIFTDASEDAYAAVGYLRIENQHGIKCVLVGSKTRVAPIKYVSIPRLELQAAVLGTRFMMSIEKSQNFKLKRRIIWTDSHTVVSWIRSDHKKYHQFVAHRIGEILEASNQEMWRWLPGKENVADEATKWVKTPNIDVNSRWFNGPAFLYQPEENWPSEEKPIESDIPEEMKVQCLYVKLIPPRMIDPNRFSNWNRMVRALAYVFHYIKILRARIYKEKLPERTLSQDELIKSRDMILCQAQYEGYTDEMALLKRNQSLPAVRQRIIPRSSSLFTCSPYLDENGLIRIRGRIDAAKEILFDQKRPIILPKKNKITSLLVGCFHRIYLHRNSETVINEIKQRYFIPQLRVMLKTVRKNCQYCKNLFARPKPPEMGNLPFARLAVGFRIFTYVGIDYFGPIKIVDGRVPKKRWGVIFTCLTTRGIHIEIAHSMETESCILCIRNFIARHSAPREIYTDNGTNFVGADNELTRAVAELDVDEMASTFTTCYTEWKFNPPEAPHQGGVWERLVRSVKTSLYDVLPDRNPTDEQLKNLMAEIQFVVNSRPLTFIPLEQDTDEALTPNHFIFGSSDGSKPIIQPEDRANLRSRWRENQRITDLFWKRFVKEYLPTLTRRTKWFAQVEPLKVGDLVLIMDAVGTRNSYPRAKVIEVIIGSNNQGRRIRVQRSDKRILTRAATNLAKLDVEPPKEGLAVTPGNNQTGGSVTDGRFISNQNVTRLTSLDVGVDKCQPIQPRCERNVKQVPGNEF